MDATKSLKNDVRDGGYGPMALTFSNRIASADFGIAFAHGNVFDTVSEPIMDPAPTLPTPSADELSLAMTLFQKSLGARFLDALQPVAPQAVFTTWITVWMLIYQRLHANATLAMAVGKFLESMGNLSSNKRVRDHSLSANTGGFSRARSRLDLAVAEQAADHVFESLLPAKPSLIAGRRIFTVDGTSLALSSHAKLRIQWPSNTNQHGTGAWPICHLALIHDLETGMAMRPETGAMYGANAESEVAIARRMLARIPAKSVLMADRNFGEFDFVFYAVQAGHDVLTRLTETRFQSMRKKATQVRPGVWEFRWRLTKANRKSHPELPANAEVFVYLHEFVGYSGQTMWVATTLDLETDRVAACYARRTEIETEIRHWKKTLDVDALRGRSVEMILKELAMASIAYHLVISIRYLASVKAKIPPKKFSFNGVWSLVLTLLFNREDRTPEEWQTQFEFALNKILQRKIPHRPNRSFPRVAYHKGPKFPIKKLKTDQEKGK